MAYCTPEDLVTRFGEKEMIQLSDKERLGTVNDERVQAAIDDASAEMDGYLSNCYDVSALWDIRIPRLVAIACDIARYRLYDSIPLSTTYTEHESHRRYTAAIEFLEKVCSLVLIDDEGVVVGQTAAGTSFISVCESRKLIPDIGCVACCDDDVDEGLC